MRSFMQNRANLVSWGVGLGGIYWGHWLIGPALIAAPFAAKLLRETLVSEE